MAQGHSNVRQVGDRIEVLLGELRPQASPEVGAKVEEVIGLLVELYGAGLERILEVVNEDAETAAPLLKRFTDDKFIESLLVLHGIHPIDVDTRIEAEEACEVAGRRIEAQDLLAHATAAGSGARGADDLAPREMTRIEELQLWLRHGEPPARAAREQYTGAPGAS